MRKFLLFFGLTLGVLALGLFLPKPEQARFRDFSKIPIFLKENSDIHQSEPFILEDVLKDIPEDNILIFHVWASWCLPCHQEHAEIMTLKDPKITLIGINYKDTPEAAAKFLTDKGNPYTVEIVDETGLTAIHLGFVGVPERLVTTKQGVILDLVRGPLENGTEYIKAIKEMTQSQN